LKIRAAFAAEYRLVIMLTQNQHFYCKNLILQPHIQFLELQHILRKIAHKSKR